MWCSVVCDLPTVQQFVLYRDSLQIMRTKYTKCMAELEAAVKERNELRHQVRTGRAGEVLNNEKLDAMYVSFPPM